jgi:site-specific DNA-methyltransferase (adenine-specific)
MNLREYLLSFQLPLNQILCGDNVEVMANFPSQSIHEVVTSPPYGEIFAYNGFSFNFPAVAKQLYRLLHPTGYIAWVVRDEVVNGSITGEFARQILGFLELGFKIPLIIIYAKIGAPRGGSLNNYNNEHEYVFVITKDTPFPANRLKDRLNRKGGRPHRKTSHRDTTGLLHHREGKKTPFMGFRGSVWWYYTGHRLAYASADTDLMKEFPAPMHEKLCKDLILSYSHFGDIVLDPFSGSGTTSKMCVLTGRNHIGIETSPDFCKIGRKRFHRYEGRKLDEFCPSIFQKITDFKNEKHLLTNHDNTFSQGAFF